MTVTATTSSTQTATTATASKSASGISSDYQTFLKMLTAQLQNQDPMNPMESSDFAVQLATFSGVEQQVKTNELLTAITGNGALSGIGQYAGWIGMEAQVPAAAWYDGTPLTLSPRPSEGADSARLIVTNASGTTVMSAEVGVDGGMMTWDGLDTTGAALPQGQYSFTLQSYTAGNLIGAEAVPVYAEVVETRLSSDGTPMLILQGGAEVEASTATALRRIE